jgi:hypothetical protein
MEDERAALCRVEKGSREYVEKIKYVREQTGLGLREAKDTVDYGCGLTAAEIVKRWKFNHSTGINIAPDVLPTICWRVHGCRYPELDGFYTELSDSLRGLIATGGAHAFELTSKSEAFHQMHAIANLAPIRAESEKEG